MAEERIPVTVELNPELVREIEKILLPGCTVENSIEELLILAVSYERFLQAAPEQYYTVPEAVSDEETSAVEYKLAPAIEALLSESRPEAVAFGLFAAGLALCTRICREAGHAYADQEGGHLASEILGVLQRKMAESCARRETRLRPQVRPERVTARAGKRPAP